MIRIAQQVSRAIRILRGNRDESARASHLVVEKDLLMTYETDLIDQAEREKCSQSTFSERKIMSTKTSIKRIAAVAAVALTLGGFSAVSASAAGTMNFNSESWVSTPTPTVGVLSSLVAQATGVDYTSGGGDYVKFTASITAEPATSSVLGNAVTVVAGATGQTSTNGTPNDATTSANWGGAALTAKQGQLVATAAGRSTAYFTVNFTPDVAGAYTLTLTDAASTATYAVTVVAVAQAFNHASAFIGAAGSSEITADAAITAAAGASVGTGAAVARLDVRQYSTTDTTTAMATPAAVTVAVSGAGLVDVYSNTGSNRGPSATATAANLQSFAIWSDGRSGIATVTVSIGGAVVSTKTVTFTGSLAKYALAATQASTFATYTPKGGTSTLTVTGLDANGNAATVGTIYAVSDNTAAATVTVSGSVVTVTGVAAGKANITVCDTASCTAAVKTLVVPVEVTLTTAASFTITTDALTYAPGQKITLTVAATDANGRPVADGALNLFSSTGLTSDVLVNSPTYTASASVTLAAGVATFTAYAPISGSVTFSATQGAAVDAVAAGGTAAVVSAPTVTVANDSADAANAATDAANEATDAANAATDAANAAADSADAATQAATDAGDKADAALAAVTALSQQVTTLLAKVAALATTIAKIAKKVKA